MNGVLPKNVPEVTLGRELDLNPDEENEKHAFKDKNRETVRLTGKNLPIV
jgi:hypothetical protein